MIREPQPFGKFEVWDNDNRFVMFNDGTKAHIVADLKTKKQAETYANHLNQVIEGKFQIKARRR